MEITETYYRRRCDNCKDVTSPTGETSLEAKTLARHVGWIIHSSGDFCVECVARLDPQRRLDLILESQEQA